MADSTKIFKIQINGLTESINAVDTLNKQLERLEERLNKVSSAKVSTGGGSTRSGNSALSQEEAVQKEINKLKAEGQRLDAKILAAQDEIYKRVDATKQLYAETVADQKAMAAQERLTANAYSNTMQGMKAQLADLKAVINATDIGDSDQIKKMTQQANELTNKLKEMEEAYGQFGRNVGNYQSAFDGFEKLNIAVGNTTREFNSAREATKTLKNELYALELQGKSDTKEADNLRKALYQLQSAMDDATKSSRAMDEAMDFMQSFTAMASVGNGLQAFFGFDDNEITKSIQKLVALQGVLNGLESLRKQMETQEGIGKILGKGFENIDKMSNRLLAYNRLLRGTGTSARVAAAGIKVLNFALKGLMSAGLLIGVDLLVEGIQKAASAIQSFIKGDADLVSSSEVMEKTLEAQNRVLEQNLDLIKKRLDAGDLSAEQARVMTEREYARALQETNKTLKERAELIALQGINSNKAGDARNATGLEVLMGDKGVTWIGGFKEGIKSIEDFTKRWDELVDAVSNEKGLNILFNTASDARDELNHLSKLVERDFLNAMNEFSDGTEKGTRALVDYIDKMDKLTGGRYSRAIELVKVDNEGLQKQLDEAWKMVQNLRDNVFKNPIVVKLELDTKIEQELDRLDPTRAAQRTLDSWKELLRKGVDEAGNVLTEGQRKNIEKIVKEQEKNIAKQKKQRLDAEKNAAKKLADESERVEREINNMRIQLMKEGLEKTLSALTEERRVKLAEAKETGIRVGEQEALIRQLYRKKELEAIKEHNKEVEKLNHDMWEQIYRSQDTSFRMYLDSQLTQYETEFKKLQQMSTEIFSARYASYGGTQLPNDMSDSLRRGLGFDLKAKKQAPIDKGMIDMAKEYLDLLEDIELASNTAIKFNDDGETYVDTYAEAKKALEEWLEANETTAEEIEKMWAVQELKNEGYTKSLSNAYKIRIREASAYYDQISDLEKGYYEKAKENELSLLNSETATAYDEVENAYAQQLAQLEESREKGLVTEEKYNELSENLLETYKQAQIAIQKRFNTESARIEQDHLDNIQRITADGMRGMLNEYRDAYSQISKLQSRQPQTFGGALGDLGIINIGATRKNYKEALDAYKELSKNILQEKQTLQEKLDANEISFDDFQQAKRELDGLSQDVADAASDIEKKMKGTFSQAMGVIAQLASQIGSQLNSMFQAFADYADQQHENAIKDLEEQIEQQEEIYKKQEELANEHKDKLNEIENELSTARGDRRQNLIDQLNAEMAAQRQALAEQKKAEKEQKKLEDKKLKEEQKRKEDQKKMAMTSAIINGATAFMNALAQQPIWLGIALAAMTAVMTAAQIATISSAKYADGGVIQGEPHSRGGVKVLGGQAEVEGNEFITNKRTTQQNVDLLYYINSKKRKLDLSDFIDFYSGDGARKNITSIARPKFADGGQLPTLRGDIDINSRLLTAFEDYSNRPVVVAVTEINDKQAAVRNVQVLAGLED